MSLVSNLLGKAEEFVHNNAFVQDVVRTLSPSHLDAADKLATHYEDLARKVCSVLPDGPELEAAVDFIQRSQRTVFNALSAASTALAAPPATTTTNGSAALTLIPGRDHPITEAPEQVGGIVIASGVDTGTDTADSAAQDTPEGAGEAAATEGDAAADTAQVDAASTTA